MKAELAVVVLAVGEMPELSAAIASLAGQDQPLEIVVVQSALPETGRTTPVAEDVRWVRSADLLPTGAARNRGVAATEAPWVAFLAGDCRALPGWARGRLAAHRAGAPIVAAALVNPHPEDLVAWAGYITLHHRRWPGVPTSEALHYGCSYSREALARVGGFADRLAAGEDTELNARLAEEGLVSSWVPSVRATHPYSTRLPEFLSEQFLRGQRAAMSWRDLGDPERARAVGQAAFARASRAARFAQRHAEPADRLRVALATPLVYLGSRSYSRGARDANHALAAK